MVPADQHGDGRRGWLPRTRGDGPTPVPGRSAQLPAPPHTRGWSHGSAFHDRDFVGSPAHAGMVPRPAFYRGRRYWLPRTRGDGPGTAARLDVRVSAPPHTRGWSRITSFRLNGRRGSPAHAGMVPTRASSTAISRGLPRTRGDGPYRLASYRARILAPPHTRGWSRVAVEPLDQPTGSLAHAGMVPCKACLQVPEARLPRTRGDGPGSPPSD